MLRRRDTGSKHGPNPWRLYVVLLALLNGCQPAEPDTPFEAYPSRIGSTQSVAPADDLQEPPVVVDLQLPIPLASLDTLDLARLTGCSVQSTLGKRNSSLGRHAKPSQRLLLELEYLRLAPPCIDLLRENHNTLAAALEAAWRNRQQQLPALIFNATLASDEYRSFWLITKAPGDYPPVSHPVVVSALTQINQHIGRWLNGDYQAQNRHVEVLLSQIAGGDAGTLLQPFYAQRSGSVTADPAIERLHTLLTRITMLERELSPVLPRQYRHWMDARNGRVTAIDSAYRREHLAYSHPSCSIN